MKWSISLVSVKFDFSNSLKEIYHVNVLLSRCLQRGRNCVCLCELVVCNSSNTSGSASVLAEGHQSQCVRCLLHHVSPYVQRPAILSHISQRDHSISCGVVHVPVCMGSGGLERRGCVGIWFRERAECEDWSQNQHHPLNRLIHP